jgi:serine protease
MTILYILFLLNLNRPPLTPITNVDIVRVESLAMTYQQSFAKPEKIEPTRAGLFNDGKFLVIGYESAKMNETEEFVRNNKGKVVKTSQTGGNYLLAYFPDFDIEYNRQILTVAKNYNFIQYIEPSKMMKKCFLPNDQYYITHQWDKWIMYADLTWDVILGSSDITVAVCDEGIDYLHPDLRDNFDPFFLGYDVVDTDPDPYPDSIGEDHGTHVAGILAGVINNDIGIAGWAQVKILSVRVLSEQGIGSDFDIAEGIRWATTNGARVINLSLGGDYSSVLYNAVQFAWNNNVLLFGSTGNDAINFIYYPAGFNECISVGALDENDRIAFFSNYGSQQELACPGVNILSTIPDSSYAIFQGTSMACPQAAGVAALILSLYLGMTNQELRAILDIGTIDLGASGRDNLYGFGLLNSYRVLELAQLMATKGKIARTPNKGFTKTSINLEDIKNKKLIFDIQGRRIDKISSKGIYFLKDSHTDKNIKKVIFR